jgi:hypothetical protein
MIGRNVERLEIVPLVLNLRPVGDREAQPPHNVLQLLDRLRDRVQMAEPQRLARNGRIELRSPCLCGRSAGQPRLGRLECPLDLRFDFVEPFPCRWFVLLGNRA